jgi:hypothetical protein
MANDGRRDPDFVGRCVYPSNVSETAINLKPPMPRVAILGWGSLLWDPKELRICGHGRPDGPWLPIEFARTSGLNKDTPPYLSLVIHPNAGLIRTYWDISLLAERREDAIADLRKREGCYTSDIGYIPNDGQLQSSIAGVDQRIREWLNSKRAEIDAVIWTNLKWKLEDREEFTVHDSIEWLDSLKQDNRHSTAQKYIQMAPSQTDTCLRSQVRERFNWKDIPIGF